MSATSASRLGLNIGAYDQVIALSQNHINETLQYHYDNNEDLKIIKTKLDTAGSKLRGKIDAPQVQLIDKEGADQALYCLSFTEGTFYWYEAKPQETNDPDDSDAPPPMPAFVQRSVPLEGWKLAFYVDFAMKKMDVIPESVRSQLNNPGSYGVDQLLIDFGTAHTMTFDWIHSELTNFPDKKSEVAARGAVSLLISQWLEGMRATEGNHNVLGYAVKVKPDQISKIPNSDPSFPPTAVRLQTINHRPEGKEDKISPASGHNAFLFTEMTGKDGPDRLRATKDLPWSGDFFYQSFGGTLIMSRDIFWDKFVKERLNDVNQLAVLALNVAAKKLAPPDMAKLMPSPGWYLTSKSTDMDTAKAAQWSSTNGLITEYKWNAYSYFIYDHEVTGPNHMYEYKVTSQVRHQLCPEVGTGNFYLDCKVELQTELKVGFGGFLDGLASFTARTACSYSNTLKVSLAAADSGGGLSVVATGSTSKPKIQADAYMGGLAKTVIDAIPGIREMYGGHSEAEAYRAAAVEIIESSTEHAVASAAKLQEALSGQRRFVFPGGGTFDMKSPIFNNKGDLLIGLSYRKGDSA
ncbi:hypothetical protein NX059_000460 [Plenodomus lindquistii]|nr:hypothetical protein NX059_000460 [Plenodomus lindquistii]